MKKRTGYYPNYYHKVMDLSNEQAASLLGISVKDAKRVTNKAYTVVAESAAENDVAIYQHDGFFMLIEIDGIKGV